MACWDEFTKFKQQYPKAVVLLQASAEDFVSLPPALHRRSALSLF